MSEIILNILREEHQKEGFLSEDALKKLSTKTKIPISKLYGIATFYSLLHTEKQGRYVIHLCGTPACYLNDVKDIERFLEKELGIEVGKTTKDGIFSLYRITCIGCCDEAPAMLVNNIPFTRLTEQKVLEILKRCRSSERLVSKR